MMPPRTVPTPSARRPLVSSLESTFLPVISPSARNMPVDSTITTIMTMHMVRIDQKSNVGMPNWKG